MVKTYKDLEIEWSHYWFKFVLDNPNKPWRWYFISINPNTKWKIIQEYPDKPWDWFWISRNPNITWEIIQANPDKQWDWNWISTHENITWEIIQSNLNKPWHWGDMSGNPDITFEIIQSNLDKPWNWSGISSNTMAKEKREFINDLRLKIIKSNIIKRYYTKRSYDPSCSFGRKMILQRALSDEDDSE